MTITRGVSTPLDLEAGRRWVSRRNERVFTSIASRILAFATMAFIALGSGLLLWDGLAAEFGRGRDKAVRPSRNARLRVVVGAIGFAIACWIGLGMLTHAR